MILRIVLLIISYLLLSAHFFREGETILTAVYLFLPLLFFIKKRWSLIFLQLFSYGGFIIWLQTIFVLTSARIQLGEPWLRMVIILGVVAIFTLLAGLLLNSNKIKSKYL